MEMRAETTRLRTRAVWTVEECATYAARKEFLLLQHLSTDRRALAMARRLRSSLSSLNNVVYQSLDPSDKQGKRQPAKTADACAEKARRGSQQASSTINSRRRRSIARHKEYTRSCGWLKKKDGRRDDERPTEAEGSKPPPDPGGTAAEQPAPSTPSGEPPEEELAAKAPAPVEADATMTDSDKYYESWKVEATRSLRTTSRRSGTGKRGGIGSRPKRTRPRG